MRLVEPTENNFALKYNRCCYCGASFYFSDAPFICEDHPIPSDNELTGEGTYPFAEFARAELPGDIIFPFPKNISWQWVKDLKMKSERVLTRSLTQASKKLSCGCWSRRQRCPKCLATLPDNARRASTFIISFVGPPLVGKSHYMAALIDVLRGDLQRDRVGLAEDLDLKFRAVDSTEEQYHQRYYEPIYERGTVLEATPSLQSSTLARVPLVYELPPQRNGEPAMNVSLFDIPGENALMRRSLNLPEGRHVLNSDAIIQMIGPATDGASVKTMFDMAGEKALRSLIEAAERKYGRNRLGCRALNIPVAVVLTKSDILAERGVLPAALTEKLEHKSLGNPKDFEETMKLSRAIIEECKPLRDLPTLLEREFTKVGFFAVSSLGFNPDGHKLKRKPAPHRVEEPFLWLLASHGQQLLGR